MKLNVLDYQFSNKSQDSASSLSYRYWNELIPMASSEIKQTTACFGKWSPVMLSTLWVTVNVLNTPDHRYGPLNLLLTQAFFQLSPVFGKDGALWDRITFMR